MAGESKEGTRREWSQLVPDPGHVGSILGPLWDVWDDLAGTEGLGGGAPLPPLNVSLVADAQYLHVN